MMRKVNSSGSASSQHTSDSVASRNISPETRLSAFSPEETRVRSSVERRNSIARGKNGFTDSGLTQGMSTLADPFTDTPAIAGGMHLSPTATSFTPAVMDYSPSFMAGPPRTTMSYLAATSEPETPGAEYTRQNGEFGPVGSARVTRAPAPAQAQAPIAFCQIGQFDYENRNRAFAIEGVPANIDYMNLVTLFNRRELSTLRGPVLTELASYGVMYAGFTDLRDATKAFEKVQQVHPEWRLHPISAKEFASKFDATRVDFISDYEGHILASVFFDGRDPNVDERALSHSFKNLVDTFGDIRAFKTIPTGQGHVIDFMVEFCDTRAAENVVFTLNGSTIDGCVLDIKLYKPDVMETQTNYPAIDHGDAISPVSRRTGSFVHDGQYVELSPTGRSTIPLGDPAVAANWTPRANRYGSRPPRHDNGRFNESRNNNQNHVDVERIRLGLDVRTTIMLRNIPNKIDQAMLKQIVDETSFGKYDFMYLRIDFANNCNVGYAFINFDDPIDIIDFATTRAGHTWNCFNSDKVAEISYATIQGKDCLVQKFRNSSVMLEHPSFRPKIFHTGNGPLAGNEDRFPGPDNPSKMRRSVENAEHVGLFAPRVGQHYRDEQRRRRSQYDRGTMSAERETYYGRGGSIRRSPSRYMGSNTNILSPSPNRSCYGYRFADNNSRF